MQTRTTDDEEVEEDPSRRAKETATHNVEEASSTGRKGPTDAAEQMKL